MHTYRYPQGYIPNPKILVLIFNFKKIATPSPQKLLQFSAALVHYRAKIKNFCYHSVMMDEYSEQPNGSLPSVAQPVPSADQADPEALADLILDADLSDAIEIDDRAIAKKLLVFFLRPKDGFENMEIFDPSAGSSVQTRRPFSRPLPLISEFSRLVGLSEKELESLGRRFPKTVGKALTHAREIQQEYVTLRGLSGDYHPRYAEFVSINLTNMRKDGQDHTDALLEREQLSGILDDIEASQSKVYEPAPRVRLPPSGS